MLLNAYTEVNVEVTVGKITKMLSEAGANAILTDYEDGYVKAISFKIKRDGQSIFFRLPTDYKPVLALLEAQKELARRKGKRVSVKVDQMQAVKVAWRIVEDWIKAQVALIQTQMVTIDQVFLPYAVTKDGKTLYEHIKSGGSNLLLQSEN